MAIYDLLIFDAANFFNAAGAQGFDDDETDADLTGNGPYSVGGAAGRTVQVDDRDDVPTFNDGTSRDQFLESDVTLSYVQDGVVQTTTFPADTTQVQAEFAVEFTSGYKLVAIRLTDPNSATTGDNLVTAGYTLVPPPGASPTPPVDPDTGQFELGHPLPAGSSDTGSTAWSEIPCFVAGTSIATPDGPRAVEEITIGDHVTCADGGSVAVTWTGGLCLDAATLATTPRLRPVGLPPGLLGNRGWLWLSPQHRVLWRTPVAELLFGSSEVLVPALSLAALPGVVRGHFVAGVRYCHFACAQHQLVDAAGATVETLLPAAGQGYLAAVLAEFSGQPRVPAAGTAVRPILKMAEAIMLTEGTRHAA